MSSKDLKTRFDSQFCRMNCHMGTSNNDVFSSIDRWRGAPVILAHNLS
jgi:hypothetical protein